MSAGALPAVLLLAAVLVLRRPATAKLSGRGAGPVPRRAPGPVRRLRWRRTPPAPPARGRVALAAAELAALLRAGASPTAAWSHLLPAAGPVAGTGPGAGGVEGVLRRAAAAAADGRDVARALTTGPCPPGAAGPVAALAAAWRVAERTGAPTADVLDRLAAGLRADAQAEDAREAALAAPRATARLLVALPPAGLLLGAAVGADPLHVLVATGPGRVCAAAGAGCTAAAWAWTRALVRTAEGGRP